MVSEEGYRSRGVREGRVSREVFCRVVLVDDVLAMLEKNTVGIFEVDGGEMRWGERNREMQSMQSMQKRGDFKKIFLSFACSPPHPHPNLPSPQTKSPHMKENPLVAPRRVCTRVTLRERE